MTTSSRAPRRFSQPSSCSPPSDYGAPVPGYDAPPDRTLQPGTRIGAFLVGVLAACHERGLIDDSVVVARMATLTSVTADRIEIMRTDLGYRAPIGLIAVGIDGFVRLHGCVTMEVFGQLRYVAGGDDAYFHEVLDQELARFGLGAPAGGTRRP